MPGGPGAGHILDMINRQRENMKHLRKTAYGGRDKGFMSASKEYRKALRKEIDYYRATPEQLAAVRQKVLRKNRIRAQQRVLLFSILGLFVAGGTFAIYALDREERPAIVQEIVEKKEQSRWEHENQYNLFLSEGDHWLEQQHWHNAAFQYNKALELEPEALEAQYKYTLTGLSRCVTERALCAEAEASLATLGNRFPDHALVLGLQRNYRSARLDTAHAMKHLWKGVRL